MTKMQVTNVRREASRDKMTYHLIVTKDGEPRTLLTPIEKVMGPPQFRAGRPIEQYAFRVAGRSVERFADAAAIVLKRHHVAMLVTEEDQEYVQRAFAIMRGDEELRPAKLMVAAA